jgi:hypothetical protein
MRRDQLPPHPTATYVMPRWRTVYVWVNKAACTSIKWLVADLQGESRDRFYRSLSREVSRTMTIHRRPLWKHTPMAANLPDERLAEIGDDWFVFAVVRHPIARMFSAWQSKLLLREPWWVDEYGDRPWFPRVPSTSDDLLEDWLGFARTMISEPDRRLLRNRHFTTQRRMLAPDRMPYTRIYETREIPQLLEDFERHVRGQGYDGAPLELMRANETPLRPLAAAFPPDVVEGLAELYRADFETWDFGDPLPRGLDPAERYADGALQEVGRLVERAERINDLALRAREIKLEAKQERAAAVAPPSDNGAPAPERPEGLRALVGRAPALARRIRRAAR